MKWTRILTLVCIALAQLTFVVSKKVIRVNRRQVIAQSLQRQVLKKSKFNKLHGTARHRQAVESGNTSTKKPTTSTKAPTMNSTKAPTKNSTKAPTESALTKAPKKTKTPKKTKSPKKTKTPKNGKGTIGAATSSGNKTQTLTKIASSAIAMIIWFYL